MDKSKNKSKSTSKTNSTLSGSTYQQYLIEDYNQVLGAIYGSIICNHYGAKLENQSVINLEQSLSMSGGGFLQVQKGEIMEESNLQLILIKILTKKMLSDEQQSKEFKFDSEEIQLMAQNYKDFYERGVKELDILTKRALSQPLNKSNIDQYLDEVEKENKGKNSNGHLARVLPIALIFPQYDLDCLKECIDSEMRITHCGEQLLNISYFYAKTLILILKQIPEKEVFEIIMKEIKQHDKYLAEMIDQKEDPLTSTNQFQEQDINNSAISFIECSQQATYPFKKCMMFLKKLANGEKRPKEFKTAINSFIKDSMNLKINLSIYGGFIGAIYGFKDLPQDQIEIAFKSLKNSDHQKTIDDFLYQLQPIKHIKDKRIKSYQSSIIDQVDLNKNKNRNRYQNNDKDSVCGPRCVIF